MDDLDESNLQAGPRWLWRMLSSVLAFIAKYGWHMTGVAICCAIVWPYVVRGCERVRRRWNRQADLDREHRLTVERQKAVERAQLQLAAASEAHAQRSRIASEAERQGELERLDREAERLGLRPRGKAHRLDGKHARGGLFPVPAGGHAPAQHCQRDVGTGTAAHFGGRGLGGQGI